MSESIRSVQGKEIWSSLVELSDVLKKAQNTEEKYEANEAIHALVEKCLGGLKRELNCFNWECCRALEWQISQVDELLWDHDRRSLRKLIKKRSKDLSPSKPSWATRCGRYVKNKFFSHSNNVNLEDDELDPCVVRDSLSHLVTRYRWSKGFVSALPPELVQYVLSCMDPETLLNMVLNKSLPVEALNGDQPHWYFRAERWGRVPFDKTISALEFVKTTLVSLRLLRKEEFFRTAHNKLSSFQLAEVLSSYHSGNLLPLVCPWMKQGSRLNRSLNILPGLKPARAKKLLYLGSGLGSMVDSSVLETFLTLGALHGGYEGDEYYQNKKVTPLHKAAEYGFLGSIHAILGAGADVNITNQINSGDGLTPLFYAAHHGHTECVNALIKAGADFNKLRVIFQQVRPGFTVSRVPRSSSLTALHGAAENGHLNCVNALIEAGAGVNSTTIGFNEALLPQRLRPSIERPNAHLIGVTALHLAAENGHLDCVNALIQAGADVNSERNDGMTPYLLAAQNGHDDCAKALTENGAKDGAPNNLPGKLGKRTYSQV